MLTLVSATVKGGIGGGLAGLVAGGVGIFAANARYPAFRALSIPFRAFILTSTSTFSGNVQICQTIRSESQVSNVNAAVIAADRYSRAFEKARHSDSDYRNQSEVLESQLSGQKPVNERIKNWVSEQRYPIVFGSWVASMAIALGLVGRNPYLTGQQKLVQARVYAQTLTLAVLVASFALESNDLRKGKGRWETVKVLDPNDPEHKKLIEKKIHHESYAGEDQWMGEAIPLRIDFYNEADRSQI